MPAPGPMRERIYRLLLLWYPRSFRRRYADDLVEAFGDMWAARAAGRPLAAAAFWARVSSDAVAGGLRTRLTRTRAPSGPYGVREDVGMGGWASGLGADARQAGRAMARTPGFAAVVVVMLAVGVGASTAVFSVLHDVVIRPLPYDQPDRLVRLYMQEPEEPGTGWYLAGTHFLAYREGLSSLEALAPVYTYAETGADVMVGDRPERQRVLQVGGDYLDVLAARPVLGRGFTRDDERPGNRLAVLSAGLWERAFDASPDALGRSIVLSGEPHTVVGVMPPGFEDPLAGPVDVWVPQDMTVTDSTNQPYNNYLSAIGRLAPGASLERARAEVDAVTARLHEAYPEQDETGLLVPLHDDLVGGSRAMLLVLFGAVGVVLLVVCVNVANLFLVRSLERRRELAMRLALGSGGVRLGRHLLLESLGLAALGGAAGLALAVLGIAGIRALAGDTIPRLDDVGLGLPVLAFALAVTAAAGVVFGLAPALRFMGADLSVELRERRGTGGRGAGRVRAGLVVAQVALSLVLLAGSGLLVASFQQLRSVDLGFRPDGAATFEVHLPSARYDGDARARFHAELTDRLASLPVVVAAGAISRLPATGRYHGWGTRALTGPRAGEEDGWVGGNQRVVEGRIFDALGMELRAGRAFDARDDAAAPRRYVISAEAAARLFPGADPLGQRIAAGGREGEVIGVVEDPVADVEGTVLPMVYHAHRQFASNRNWALTYVVRTAGDEPMAVIPAFRRALAQSDPQLVLFRPAPLDAVVGQGRAERAFALGLMLAFAAIALALATLGLYAVLAFAVAQRRQELGVRMALGATAREIHAMVQRRGLALAAAGAALGLAATLVASRWLRSLVFEVSVNDPRVLGLVTLLVLVVAGAAATIPAVRATRVEPRSVLEEG